MRDSVWVSRGLRDEPLIFFFTHQTWDGVADFLEIGKVPQVRKVPALLRLHGLHGTVVAFKKNAFAIGFVEQRQTEPIRT